MSEHDVPMFRIQIELVGGDIVTFDNLPGEAIVECLRLFVLRENDGLGFTSDTGEYFWTWDEIRGVGALRMVALTGVELQPRVVRTMTAAPPTAQRP